jgi:signal transduction histidine kinase
VAEITDAMLVASARDEEHLRRIRQLELRSYMAVPLRAQGKCVGVISLALSGANPRRYTQADLNASMALAERAGLAMTNASLYADAERARREAERANRSKDEFLAMLGHELRNPLAPILTALQLMKLRQPGVFEKERAVVERQVRHMVTLVDDLLDVSRIARGRFELTKEELELADVVQRGLELAQPLIEERRHDLVIDVPRTLRVFADPVRLGQVFANLLTNSAKYTNPGGHISVTASRLGQTEVEVSVKDDGVGIEAELLPHVFSLFVQGRQSLDRSRGGLGLGLAIVHSVVRMHGGRVSARSDGAGKGSEFRVVLPLFAAAADRETSIAARASLPRNALPPVRAARVLVVDDNLDARMLLLEGLQMLGHRTFSAEDAASALALAQAFQPEVALLDIGLPVMNGYELARQLRQLPGLDKIKLVAVTGYGQPADKDQAAAAGFDEHLIKPISLEQVQSALARLVNET